MGAKIERRKEAINMSRLSTKVLVLISLCLWATCYASLLSYGTIA